MAVLITGASGFIGRRLTDKLLNDKQQVITLSRQHNKIDIFCDLSKGMPSSEILKNIDTVFHLAAISSDIDINNDEEYEKINVDTVINLADLASRNGVRNFIFISSVKAGGKNKQQKCSTEYDCNEPEGIYAKTKRKAELGLIELSKKSSLNVKIIRPAPVYGPDCKGNLKTMFNGVKQGWLPRLKIINNKRSLIHIDDLVDFIVLISKDNKKSGEIYILTDNQNYCTQDIYDSMCSSIGKSIPKWSVPYVLINSLRYLHPRIEYIIGKLVESECYRSKKIKQTGFFPKKTIWSNDAWVKK